MHRPIRSLPRGRRAAVAHVALLVFALAAPGIGRPVAAQAPAASPPSAQAATAPTPVDVNTATAEQLDALPGIGPSKVEAILRLRAERPFRRLTDLLRVPGIGRATLERLRPYLAFPAAPARR